VFVVTTIVAVALGLLAYYPGFAGLFFAVMVLCAGGCYLRGNRFRAVVCLGLLAASWLGMQFFGPYTSLRNRVVWVVGTDRLQEWAVETLDNLPQTNETVLFRDTLPEDIRSIAEHDVTAFQSVHGSFDYLLFSHGGKFHQWGILVGRPGYTPPSSRRFHYDKIGDGIWGFRTKWP
jgi:hypothetical protein